MTAKSKPAKLPGSWSLFRITWADLRRDWKLYFGIVALVTIPTDILSTYFGADTGTTFAAYLSIAGIFMDVALIYAVVRRHREGDDFGLRTAYYSGSHAVLRFLLVALMLGVMILPLAIGTEIYGLGVAGGGGSVGESFLLGIIGLPFVLVSLWLLARCVLSLIMVVDREVHPISAIRFTWRLTRRRFWPVFGRLMSLLGYVLLALISPIVVFGGLYLVSRNSFFALLLQVAISLIILPLVVLYGFHLYDKLDPAAAELK